MRCSKQVRGVALAAMAAMGACDRKATPAPGAQQATPVEVGVVKLEAKRVVITTELPGRTSAYRVAEVRARVNGVVLERKFAEGTDVTEGQALFRVDPAPYAATLESARASVTRAAATLERAKVGAKRAEQLLAEGVGSQQEVDNAAVALKTAEADLAAARAATTSAGINLGFTAVTAPIAGRIGRAEVTEGAYVQQSPATLLATIQQLDPMYVDLTWSSAEALRLRRDVASGKLKTDGGKADVKLLLEDGREYAETGKLQFTDVSVDPSTGSVSLRGLFPNPKHELLPGMFVRARLEEGERDAAVLAPQRGITRDPKGQAIAMVVNAASKIERRVVVTDRAFGDAWLVLDGLRAGDQVVVEGLQKIRPDQQVVAVPAREPASPAPDAGAPR